MRIAELLRCKHVCFGGCGARAVFYYGVMKYLGATPAYAEFYDGLEGVAGTSSGAMAALALCVNADFGALARACIDLGISSAAPGVSVHDLFERFGLDDGAALRAIIAAQMQVIGLATSLTFGALHRVTKKTLAVCATDLHHRRAVYFSHRTHPDMSIADALYMSMCVPVALRPQRHDGTLYADGGLTANVPLGAFPHASPAVLCLNVLKEGEPANLRDYAILLLTCTLGVQRAALRAYAASAPNRVFEFDCDALELLTASPDALLGLSRHGYAAALLSDRPELARALVLAVAALLRQSA